MQRIAIALLATLVVATTSLAARAEAIRGTEVALRDTVTAEIDTRADLDTYVFDAAAGTRLDIALAPQKGASLTPRATLLSPAGHVIDVADTAKWKRGALRWKGVTLNDTGRYAIVVQSQGLSSGGYRLKLRGKPPAKRRIKALPVAPGQSVRITYGAAEGTTTKVRVGARSGTFAVTDVDCPAGETELHDFQMAKGDTRATAKLRHGGALGERAFTLRAGDEGALIDVSLAFSHARTRSRRLTMGEEPTVSSISPPSAKPGERVTLLGSGFVAGADGRISVLFGGVEALDAVVLDSGRIEVTVPAGMSLVDVVLHNADGQEGSAAEAFRYVEDTTDEPEDTGLAAHWEFDATTGVTVADLTGNGFTGAVAGGASWTGDALSFDGVDDVVTYTDIYGNTPSDVGNITYGTITAWVRYDDVTNNGEQLADNLPLLYYGISHDDYLSGYGTDALCVYIGHTGMDDDDKRQIYLTVIADDEIKLCIDSDEISLESGRWYHYAITIGPDGHHGYLDGVEFEKRYNAGTDEDSHGFFSSVEDDAVLMSGHGWLGITGNWWHHNGRLGTTRIYDRVLSASEIAELADTR